jgi:hypothetical protein
MHRSSGDTLGNNSAVRGHHQDTKIGNAAPCPLFEAGRSGEKAMRKLLGILVAIATLDGSFLLPANAMVLAEGATDLRVVVKKARPIEKAAICYGVGWRGAGYYPSILGLRPACWDMLPYGGPAYPAPAYIAAPIIETPPAPPISLAPARPSRYHCDNPRGYYPFVPTCAGGWRLVPATP